MTEEPGPGSASTESTASTASVTLRTLGGAALFSSAETEPLLGPGKPLALLIYIALMPGRRISRESLAELLWADLDSAHARNVLRQTVFHLRRILGEGALVGTEELALSRHIEIDRDLFLAAIERGDLEAALELYGGAFLPAFGVPGGANFEQWADTERDRLRSAYLRSAELVVRRQLNQSRFREAQRLARRVRDEAPDAEAAWRLLLETAVASRDFISAAVEAEALESWASSEAFTLESATVKAIARARRASSEQSSVEDSSLVADLTGREREFSAITLAWESAKSNRARHLHLAAPAGIGKTRLLRDAVARLRAAGAAVAEVRGLPGDREIPYALAGDLAVAIAALRGAAGVAPASAAALIALNPAVSSYMSGAPDQASGDDALRRRILALADLVQAVADEQPFVLAIDDLHWADRQSFQVLEGLVARLNGAHVLCITAARPECILADDGLTILRLGALTPAQVSSFASALAVLPAGASWCACFVEGLHSATDGSPLLILETLRLAIAEEIISRDKGEWHCLDESRLTALLRSGEALRQRLRTLPENQRWVLALLATAGTPLTHASIGIVVGCSAEEALASLATLELNGWVVRSGEAWMPAHDEVSAAGRDALEPQERAAAERAIGELLLGRIEPSAHELMRGVRHMMAAGDEAQVQKHFRRYARVAREKKDGRAFAALAAELLGEDVTSPRVRTLVNTLPQSWRIGLWSTSRQLIAAGFLAVIAAGGWVSVHALNTSDAMLQRLIYSDSSRSTQVFSVHPADWDGRVTPLVAGKGSTSLADAALAFPQYAPAISPDGKSIAWNQQYGDSTTIDIWIRTPAGARRLTRHNRDDLVTGWLADGSAIVGVTSRWSPPLIGNYKVAIFDTATGAARQITRGPGHDGMPLVSPDGTRIAFVHETDDSPLSLCVTAIDGRDVPECRLPGGYRVQSLLGWRGPNELVATIEIAGAHPVIRYDWQRNDLTTLFDSEVRTALMSPNRRWIAATATVKGIRGLREWIIPVDEPTHARLVEWQTGGPSFARWWEGPADWSEMVDRIEFADSIRTVLPGIGTRLRIRAFSAAQVELPVVADVRWRSSDTLVASVDSTGNMQPLKSGSVTIEASLAGWRKVRRRIEVRASTVTTLLDERWDNRWRTRWITFGDPQPSVVNGPGNVPAFWNRGDGTYQSVGIFRRALSGKEGLGVEVRLSTRVNEVGVQRAGVVLVAGIDTVAFKSADQRKAAPWPVFPDAVCGVTYPSGSGQFGRSNLGVMGGTSQQVDLGSAAERLGSGEWWTLRVQILPDGRCGVAVNDHVVWLSPEPISLDSEFYLRLGDESAGAKLLHGPLQLWSGVGTDVKWSR